MASHLLTFSTAASLTDAQLAQLALLNNHQPLALFTTAPTPLPGPPRPPQASFPDDVHLLSLQLRRDNASGPLALVTRVVSAPFETAASTPAVCSHVDLALAWAGNASLAAFTEERSLSLQMLVRA